MKILKYKYILSAALLSTMLGLHSCVNDLDTVPLDKEGIGFGCRFWKGDRSL